MTAPCTFWPVSLAVGLVCNALVRPVKEKWLMKDEPLAHGATAGGAVAKAGPGASGIGVGGFGVATAIPWALVGLPILWGVWKALESAAKMFQ
ncbi:protein of unknown function [Methylocella tundrae]|uniref:Uncharacterized protein n=1 Tax=Methylocella tundrae TaxID=227605 RepID=A0A4U8YTL5_METTU|nr:protein of unknown function [Methylocella tundrae]